MGINLVSTDGSTSRKWNAVLTVFFLFFSFLPFSTQAIELETISYTDELIKLEENYDSILDTQESKRCLAYTDKEKLDCDVYEDIVVYLYKTDTIPTETVVNKNTAQIAPNTYKIYGSDTFYQDEQTNTWKQTEFGVIEKNDFTAVQEDRLKSIDTILKLNNPFGIYSVNAQSPINSSAGDGVLHVDDSTYNTAWEQSNADSVDTGSGGYRYHGQGLTGSTYHIDQFILPFDTSSLSDCVSSSTLVLLGYDNGGKYHESGTDKMIVAELTTMADNSSPSISDYNKITTTKFSDLEKTINTWSANNPYLLNTDGEESIDVSGYSYFALRTLNNNGKSAPTNWTNWVYTKTSEQSGTANDPYLLVATESCPPECGDAECNGDETCETCENDCGPCEEEEATTTLSELPALPFVDDLTVITGRTDHYESSTTAADWSELHYYRVPALLWWILTSTFLFILGFILSQIQRILRKKK